MTNIIREFASADRYLYDFGLCSYENGFSQVDTRQDAPYFGTWANPYRLVIFCYCEGDCITTVCDNADDFITEINALAEWNKQSGHWMGIDPGLNPANKQRWIDLGLGEFLH